MSLCGSLVLCSGATGSLSEQVDSVPVTAQLWPTIRVTWGAFKTHCRGIRPSQQAHSLPGGARRCWRSSLSDSAVQSELRSTFRASGFHQWTVLSFQCIAPSILKIGYLTWLNDWPRYLYNLTQTLKILPMLFWTDVSYSCLIKSELVLV